MTSRPASSVRTTHDVTNQPPPLEDYDAYQLDAPLREALERSAEPWVTAQAAAYGPVVGSAETIALGFQANQSTPQLRTHDRYGHRIDEVDYHPAYHALMERAMRHHVHSATWRGRTGGQVAHAALLYLHAQAEPGTMCPLTMTHAAVPSLRLDPEIAAEWIPRVLRSEYDSRSRPAAEKTSATIGMAMTEKQGGSDVRSNTTRALPLSAAGHDYTLTGHKWFCSAPMSDAFLTLAQTEAGVTCFLVPRFWRDGSRNRIFIQRLKDKLGNRSNASSEIEYDQCLATRIGEEGRGVATIIAMVAQTRLDCAAGSAGLMRQATLQAIHHARHRSAFGRLLASQPLMQNVLADLALETEAALSLSLRVARSLDMAGQPDHPEHAHELAFSRVATALAKYWVTRRAPRLIGEAMECLGGAGYVEESGLPRLYREAPVNSIWEGSGNVQCLDVLRSVARQPESLAALSAELERARGGHAALDAHLDRIRVGQPLSAAGSERAARRWTEDLALGLTAGLLVRTGPQVVSDAYCAGRLGPDRALEYGGLPDTVALEPLIDRAVP